MSKPVPILPKFVTEFVTDSNEPESFMEVTRCLCGVCPPDPIRTCSAIGLRDALKRHAEAVRHFRVLRMVSSVSPAFSANDLLRELGLEADPLLEGVLLKPVPPAAPDHVSAAQVGGDHE